MHKALQAENATPILVQNNNKEAKMHPNKPQEKQGVPQWRVSVSHEVNEQAFNLTNWAQEYNQCSAGRFEGRVDDGSERDSNNNGDYHFHDRLLHRQLVTQLRKQSIHVGVVWQRQM